MLNYITYFHTFGILVNAWIDLEAEARPEADLADLEKQQTIPNKKSGEQFISEKKHRTTPLESLWMRELIWRLKPGQRLIWFKLPQPKTA